MKFVFLSLHVYINIEKNIRINNIIWSQVFQNIEIICLKQIYQLSFTCII
jgi:hypothetical protein